MALGEGKIYVSLDVATPVTNITNDDGTSNIVATAGGGANQSVAQYGGGQWATVTTTTSSPSYTGSFTSTFPLILTGSQSVQWNEWPSAETPCDEHVLDGKSCEITPEGRFSGVCQECGVTLIVSRIPGGVDYLMVRDLMRYLMGGGDAEDVAGEILELQTALREQQRAVEEGLELLEIAKQKLAQQAVAV